MTKRVLTTWNFTSLEDMLEALHQATADAEALGHHPSTVYPNKLRLALVEETLTDGSKVLNLALHDGHHDQFTVMGRTDNAA